MRSAVAAEKRSPLYSQMIVGAAGASPRPSWFTTTTLISALAEPFPGVSSGRSAGPSASSSGSGASAIENSVW